MIPEDRTHAARVESYIYMMLLYITWFNQMVFIPLRWELEKHSGKPLSIIRTVNHVMNSFQDWLFSDIASKELQQIMYFCSYDTRRRPNAVAGLGLFYKEIG